MKPPGLVPKNVSQGPMSSIERGGETYLPVTSYDAV